MTLIQLLKTAIIQVADDGNDRTFTLLESVSKKIRQNCTNHLILLLYKILFLSSHFTVVGFGLHVLNSKKSCANNRQLWTMPGLSNDTSLIFSM